MKKIQKKKVQDVNCLVGKEQNDFVFTFSDVNSAVVCLKNRLHREWACGYIDKATQNRLIKIINEVFEDVI